jgi:hypothetical protein
MALAGPAIAAMLPHVPAQTGLGVHSSFIVLRRSDMLEVD